MPPGVQDNVMGNGKNSPIGLRLTSYSEDTSKQASPDASGSAHLSDKDGLSVTNVSSIYVCRDNIKWFITGQGMLSFDGAEWKVYGVYANLPLQDLKGLTCLVDTGGSVLWIASPHGATVIRQPMDSLVNAHTYNPENSGILSKNVVDVVSGKNSILWIGTDKGVSALSDETWLTPDYQMHYTKNMFRDFPITSMATSPGGDSLYVGTAGAGIARIYHDELDAISGASVYAEWGPIILPSDYILSVFIAPDGALDNWTVYTEDDGLIDNYVQAICGDKEGNMWFGTQEGLSVFNGSSWLSYTTDDGLASNNIFSLAIDNEGIVWIVKTANLSIINADFMFKIIIMVVKMGSISDS
jgi:ligand-binding sensor domain-containing protein